MHVGLLEQLEREGQKEVENPGKGSRALKTKGIEDKISFLLPVGEGLSSGFTKILEAGSLWTPCLAYRKKGWLCGQLFPFRTQWILIKKGPRNCRFCRQTSQQGPSPVSSHQSETASYHSFRAEAHA